MLDIEKSQRLVEKEITMRRAIAGWQSFLVTLLNRILSPKLCEHAGEIHTLHFAAAERLIIAIGELGYVKVLHHLVDNLFIDGPRPATEMWITTHHHDF